jgi:WD40 repeat protein
VRIDDAEYARDARFAPGGNRLYLAHYRSTVQAWDPRDGSFVRSLETGLEPVDRVAVSPDGRWLVAAGAEVVVFDTAAGSRRRLAPPLSPDVLAFDPGGGLLATASRYGGMQLWEIATGRALPTAAGHTARVEQVRLSADGTWVLSADRDGNLLRWSVATGEATFLGYGSWFAGAAPSGADGALPALERGGRVVGVERATGEVLWRQADPARAAALCPGGARVLVLREAGRIDVVSAATGERLESFAGPPGGPADAIRCRDADHAVAWRGEMLDRWRRGWRWTVTPVAPAFDARVVPSPDGRWAVLLAGGCARRFDADTEIVSACIPAPSSAGVAALSGDGRTLAVETPRGAAVWDVDSARLLAEPDAAGRRVTALDLSGDGGLLAAGLDDRTILVVPVPPPSTPRPLDPARGGPLDPSTP